ncbi:MAG: Clp protease N-terminal domain-containing protein [Chloroflexi bacterium]|nr:Clp protease N-terminal domain-containing protein [Chloroflexota bacterium]
MNGYDVIVRVDALACGESFITLFEAYRRDEMDDRFDRISEQVKQLIEAAQDEAKKLKHDRVGAEDLLSALLRDQSGTASKLLRELGVSARPSRKTLRKLSKKARRERPSMTPVKLVGFVGVVVLLLVVLVNRSNFIRNMRARSM